MSDGRALAALVALASTAARLALASAAAVLALASAAAAQELRLQDPMRPHVVAGPASEPRAPASLSLTTVLVSDKRRIAVINGRVYHVGDRVNGEEILAIEPGVIRLRRGAGDVTIRVRKRGAGTAGNDGEQGQ